MVWFKVDDGFWSHSKVLELSAEAGWLWTRAGAYCANQLTDGKVTPAALRMLAADRDAATELVLAGLWDVDSDGSWWFHDWAHYQPTREDVLKERKATRERVAKHRQSRASNGVTNGVSTDAPSRPVPSRPDDFYSPSISQSRDTRASVSTDAIEVSEMTRRLASQQGVTSLRAVVDAIGRHTGITVTADQAYQVSVWLLGKAKAHPSAPQRYVTGAIAKSPHEIAQHIHGEVA